MKRNGSEKLPSFSLRSEKLPSFSLRSEKLPSFSLRSETEAKNCHHFRFEAKRKRKTAIIFASKRNGSEKLPSFSLRSEMKRKTAIIFASKRNEAKFFRFDAKKNIFACFRI
jgi:hypothetical protein